MSSLAYGLYPSTGIQLASIIRGANEMSDETEMCLSERRRGFVGAAMTRKTVSNIVK